MNLTPFLSVSRIVFAISFLLTFSPSSIIAQMNISQAMTPTQYVNNVLLGEGVTATNVSFSGSLEQIGYMTNGGAFGIESGVVLSSDQASNPEPMLDSSIIKAIRGLPKSFIKRSKAARSFFRPSSETNASIFVW